MNKEISITFMSGPLDGKTLRFEQPEPSEELVLTIGRRDGCDIHLPFDNQVSRLHARLGCHIETITSSESVAEPYVMSFWLEDLNSRNGTFIERDKKTIRGKVSLRPGTIFRIARTWMRLDVPLSL
ncbi:MAG: FHA domain-containing protein [Pleurocapsa minor GSE-CHR-MK-17-07R]|jgi:pSer/pThr/pTyr-binding forkhead associated (FHA) protein|nr:FHA domain-containing protein [Pleurocapsa minor GSE-CHR-MK 17-07R]